MAKPAPGSPKGRPTSSRPPPAKVAKRVPARKWSSLRVNYIPPMARPKKKFPILWVILSVVVAVTLSLVAFYLAKESPSPGASVTVTVTELELVSNDSVCGASSRTTEGFTTVGGGTFVENLSVTNFDFLTVCTITSLRAVTAGFSLNGATVPLTIPPEGSANLTFAVQAPATSYTGWLIINLS